MAGGLLPGSAASVRGADMDGGRRVVCHDRPGRGVAGGAPLPVVAEHGPRLCDVAGAVVVVPGTARRDRAMGGCRGSVRDRVPVVAAERPDRRALAGCADDAPSAETLSARLAALIS